MAWSLFSGWDSNLWKPNPNPRRVAEAHGMAFSIDIRQQKLLFWQEEGWPGSHGQQDWQEETPLGYKQTRLAKTLASRRTEAGMWVCEEN